MDWAIYQPSVRFDARAERKECEFLFKHQARVLQDRMARRGHTDRSKHHAIPEWEKLYQAQAGERRLLHHARVLSWAKRRGITSPTRNPSARTQSATLTEAELRITQVPWEHESANCCTIC